MRTRFSLLLIAAGAAVALAVAPGAAAQVAVSGAFHGPHGTIHFHSGVPFAPVDRHWGRGYGYEGSSGHRGGALRGSYGQGYRTRWYPRSYGRPYVRHWARPYDDDGYYAAPRTVIVKPAYGYGSGYDCN